MEKASSEVERSAFEEIGTGIHLSLRFKSLAVLLAVLRVRVVDWILR